MGNWQLSPHYDITFSLTRFGEHSIAFFWARVKLNKAIVGKLGKQAGYPSWQNIKQAIQEISYVINFRQIVTEYDIKVGTIRFIEQRMNDVYQESKAWIE